MSNLAEKKKRIIDKIRKLLRLSSSSNEHEAAAAAAKAQELLSEYNLSLDSMITEECASEMTASRAYKKTRQRLESWAYTLASGVSNAFDCKYYHDPDVGETVFVGCEPDTSVCSWTYGYLYKTLLSLASAHMRGPARRLRSTRSKKAARLSFLLGAVMVISRRLKDQKKATPITPGMLVPFKEAAISKAMPELRERAAPKTKIRDLDFEAGMDAGHAIHLSTPLSTTRPTLQRLG